MQTNKNLLLLLSLLLSVLVVVTSAVAIMDKAFYASETLNWRAQSIAQDWVDLCLISPVLLLSSIFARRGNKFAGAIWVGTLFYLTYTFTIYCFSVHFNKLFVIYCLVLCLSFYMLLYALLNYYRAGNDNIQQTKASKVAAWYFISIAVLFYGLWLSEIIPAIWKGVTPQTVVDAGLPTNAVHVIDLSIFLPAIGLVGVFLLKRKRIGFLFASPFLAFFVLMDITIEVIILRMRQKGFDGSLGVVYAMITLAIFSLMLLSWFVKSQANRPSNEIVSKDHHHFPIVV